NEDKERGVPSNINQNHNSKTKSKSSVQIKAPLFIFKEDDQALRNSPVDYFSEGASWRMGKICHSETKAKKGVFKLRTNSVLTSTKTENTKNIKKHQNRQKHKKIHQNNYSKP